MVTIPKDKINPQSQYLVVLNVRCRLIALPDVPLLPGEPIGLIGSAAIELYDKLDKISLLEEVENA